MEIEYRKADIGDAERLVEIYNASFYSDYIKYGECPAYGRTKKMMEQSIIDYPKFLIIYDGNAVGCISCKELDKGIYEVGCLCVIPEFQGRGIGTSAMNFAKSHYSDWKKFTLITPVDKKENVRFYTEKCGFSIQSEEMDGNVRVVRFVLDRNGRIGDEIELIPVMREEIETVWKMQVEAFSELLNKYHDYETSPASEGVDRVSARFDQPGTKYYFIVAKGEKVGVIRVIDKKDGSRKRISPIWIMAEYRNKGYAQAAMEEAERIYGKNYWCLDTILQEKGNLYLYEKMGYHQTGKVEHINERMDIVFYEKD